MDPSSDPKLHAFLEVGERPLYDAPFFGAKVESRIFSPFLSALLCAQSCVGFDCVDDESLREMPFSMTSLCSFSHLCLTGLFFHSFLILFFWFECLNTPTPLLCVQTTAAGQVGPRRESLLRHVFLLRIRQPTLAEQTPTRKGLQ